MCKETLFQAKHSRCLSSSSYLGASSLYVFSSTIIQMVSRGFTSREFASRSRFAIKFPNPSDTMSACAPPFCLQGFPIFARNFEIGKLNFFYLSVLWIYYAYTYSFFDNISHTFKKRGPYNPWFVF